jgi:hypothetical protein
MDVLLGFGGDAGKRSLLNILSYVMESLQFVRLHTNCEHLLDFQSIYPKIMEEPHFGCVRRSRTHPKCDLILIFWIGSKG